MKQFLKQYWIGIIFGLGVIGVMAVGIMDNHSQKQAQISRDEQEDLAPAPAPADSSSDLAQSETSVGPSCWSNIDQHGADICHLLMSVSFMIIKDIDSHQDDFRASWRESASENSADSCDPARYLVCGSVDGTKLSKEQWDFVAGPIDDYFATKFQKDRRLHPGHLEEFGSAVDASYRNWLHLERGQR